MAPTLEEKREKRLEEWKRWLNTFLITNKQNPAPEYVPIEFAAELLNDFYWELYRHSLKGLLKPAEGERDHNLHYYKIISASEISIMSVLPLTFKDEANTSEEDVLRVNAEFAWFVGITILLNWIINKDKITYESLEEIFQDKEVIDYKADGSPVYYPLNFRDEHIEWLMDVNVATAPLPVLVNSHTWRLLFLSSKEKDQIRKENK